MGTAKNPLRSVEGLWRCPYYDFARVNAQKGSVMKQLTIFFLGACLLLAGSVEEGLQAAKRGEYDRAYALWSPIEQQRDPVVAYYLGYMFDRGYGVTKNKAESFHWYEVSSKQGFARAQFKLGMLYRNRRDAEHSTYWFARAAEQGDRHSQKKLADAYEHGYGVTANDESALFWYTKLSENGDQSAKGPMARLMKKLAAKNGTVTKTATLKPKSSYTGKNKHLGYCVSRSATLAALKQATLPKIVDVQKVDMSPMEIMYGSGKTLLKRLVDREGVMHEQTWYENGQLRSKVSYKYGLKTGEEQTWYSDGTRQTSVVYKLGRLNGPCRTWYANGKLRSTMHYKRGILTRDASTWYASGNKQSTSNYNTGLLEGKLLYWYDNGTPAAQAAFAHGKADGTVTVLYANGTQKETGHYFLGKRNGLYRMYDDNGKLTQKNSYHCGKKI